MNTKKKSLHSVAAENNVLGAATAVGLDLGPDALMRF
jgi:hypothetical protein